MRRKGKLEKRKEKLKGNHVLEKSWRNEGFDGQKRERSSGKGIIETYKILLLVPVPKRNVLLENDF